MKNWTGKQGIGFVLFVILTLCVLVFASGCGNATSAADNADDAQDDAVTYVAAAVIVEVDDTTTTAETPADEIPAAADADDAVVEDDDAEVVVVLTREEFDALLAGFSLDAVSPAALTVDDADADATTPATSSLANILEREDAILATWEFIQNGFVINGEVMTILSSVFDDGIKESDYDEIYFPAVGGETVYVTLRPGQVLYLSAGIYTIILPDGEFLVRGFGETRVANDYFFMPGDYVIVGWPTPTTPERGTFSAIGGRIIDSASMMAELDASFAAPLLMPGPDESLREASQHGRAKEASYSWFFMEDGTLYETITASLGDRANVSLN